MGEEYYVFSIEFNQGAFQTRLLLPGNLFGDLKKVIIPPAPSGSFPWFLSSSNVGNLILNLRAPVSNPVVKKWLNSPQKVYLGGWVYWETDYIQEVEINKQYDGIIFIDKTMPTRPTAKCFKKYSPKRRIIKN
ncbi:hypothetical protein BH23BAC1_BH23BAC1_16190 [soil metagenome]